MSAIRFEQVSKRFTLHRERPRSFQELFLSLSRNNRPSSKEPFWALRDVSFAIQKGETVGLVGPNGAGKSTALKLMSRIIEPTSGQIEINGRVGALLELGAGFHPDLTGRENIYLNGSILGFSRARMKEIFADILDFSEMVRFIDVPVKHYSSGMYMRLAFSIAIYLDPEILLVDEVLAVGDQAFQSRCLDKINEMKRQGTTILMVTHDMAAVRRLCDRAIWLEDGQIEAEGAVGSVLGQYMEHVLAQEKEDRAEQDAAPEEAEVDTPDLEEESPPNPLASERWGSREGEIVGVQLLDGNGQEQNVFQTGDTVVVQIDFLAKRRIEKPMFGLALHHESGFHISGPNTVFAGLDIEAVEGLGRVRYTIASLPLLPGTYLISATFFDYHGEHAYDFHKMAYSFRVEPNQAVGEKYGSFLIPSSWSFEPLSWEKAMTPHEGKQP